MNTASEIVCPTLTYACQIIDVTALNATTFQVDLQSPVGTVLGYRAGQYLQLDLDINGDGQLHSLFYSIANGFDPKQARRLQIFIQNTSELVEAILKRFTQLSENSENIKVTLPMGQAYLQTDLDLTHLLIAAGSGIAKIKCLSEEIIRQQANAAVNIYWSNRQAHEFYLLNAFQNLADQYAQLNFTPILASADKNWQGRSGYIYQIIQQDFANLDGIQAYLCGSPKMVYGTIDKLDVIGLKQENCYSDVFEYAPRK